MKTFRTSKGPFAERPYYTDQEIERICSDALSEAGFLPTEAGPVRIERFIEKRFSVRVIYGTLEAKVLGFTEFGSKGVEAVYIANPEERTPAAERRVNSTLAHEAGHGLMHAHLFALDLDHAGLFGGDPDVSSKRVLCRDGEDTRVVTPGRKYDGRWWELQANRAIGALLMPKDVFLNFMDQYLEKRGTFGSAVLTSRRSEAIRAAAEMFDVNPAAVKVRVDAFFPEPGAQLTL